MDKTKEEVASIQILPYLPGKKVDKCWIYVLLKVYLSLISIENKRQVGYVELSPSDWVSGAVILCVSSFVSPQYLLNPPWRFINEGEHFLSAFRDPHSIYTMTYSSQVFMLFFLFRVTASILFIIIY